MTRRLFYLLAVVSLLLCVATVVLWVMSYWKIDGVGYQGSTTVAYVDSNRGELILRHETMTLDYGGFGRPGWEAGQGSSVIPWTHSTTDPGTRWNFRLLGFWCYARGEVKAAAGQTSWWPLWEVAVPHPAVALLLAVLPALAIRHFLARRRPTGLCRACGYDLRATPGRCLECGILTASSAQNSD